MAYQDGFSQFALMKARYLLPALMALSGCATLSETECQTGDWFGIGKSDGAKGRSAEFILEHAKACNEFGIAPKAAPWRAGRVEGLKLYCTPQNAYKVGARGQRLSNVCAGDTQVLEDANFRGRKWHEIGREMDEIEDEISDINDRLAELPDDDPARANLVSERSFLRLDLLGLRAERARYRF